MRRWLALCALALAAPALAAPDHVIRFGLTGDYPPFAERHADGSFDGADIVTAQKVAEALGARAEFVVTSWQTLLADFAAGRFDVGIGGLTVTPERAALGTFSIPLMEDGKRPLSRCADKAQYASIAAIDRPGVRVMVNRVPGLPELARGWFHQATIIPHAVDATLLQDLLAGHVDLWVTDGVVVDHMARRYAGTLCATTRTPFTHLTKAWLIRRDPAFVSAINGALEKAVTSGSWQAALEAVP